MGPHSDGVRAAAVAILLLGAPSVATSQEVNPSLEPSQQLRAVEFIFDWLDSLGDRVDQIIVKEKYAQLVRSVTRLSKNLMKLELDMRGLNEALAQSAPDMILVTQGIADLKATLMSLREDLNEMSFALRQQDRAGGIEAEALISQRLGTRAVVLDELERLARAGPTEENLTALRQRAEYGHRLVNQAQIASISLLAQLKEHAPD